MQSEKKYAGVYDRSKLADVVFTYELARRLSGTGVTANVLHPGLVRTGFANNMGVVLSSTIGFVMRFVALTPQQGAQTSIYLASSPEVKNVTGKYFVDCKVTQPAPQATDSGVAKKLWDIINGVTAYARTIPHTDTRVDVETRAGKLLQAVAN